MNKKRLLPVMGGTKKIFYLLRDLFLTDDAPLTSPRTCEPGGGTLTITDAGNKLSISNDSLVMATGAAYKLVGSQLTRANGLSVYCRDKLSSINGERIVGFSTNGTLSTDAIYTKNASGYNVYQNNTSIGIYGGITSVTGCYHEYLVLLRSTGFIALIRGGKFGRWTILYISNKGTDATLSPIYNNPTLLADGIVKELSSTVLSGICSTDFGLASYHISTPTSPVEYSGKINGWVEIVWTPAEGETLEIDLHKVDADNRGIIRCSQTNSTIKMISEVGGSETEKQSAAQTFTVGTPYRVAGRLFDSGCVAYVDDVGKLTQPNPVFPVAGRLYGASGFTTATDFAVFSLENSLPKPYSDAGFHWFYSVGDSKTASRTYQGHLLDLLETATSLRWGYENSAYTGYTVANVASIIAAELADTVQSPDAVLINLGPNDLASLPAEATWKANYVTIITAIHAKWGNAKIYLAKPVRLQAVPASTPHADTATMHGYIDDLIATYDYVYEGLDETDLEGGDGYLTYFADALHPNVAGYVQCATLWKTALGY